MKLRKVPEKIARLLSALEGGIRRAEEACHVSNVSAWDGDANFHIAAIRADLNALHSYLAESERAAKRLHALLSALDEPFPTDRNRAMARYASRRGGPID